MLSNFFPCPNCIMQAGGTIRLFHREIECYLVAEGSFAERPGQQVVENVHLRKRKSDHGKLKSPSTSAITYWTIEKKKEPLSGELTALCSGKDHALILLGCCQ